MDEKLYAKSLMTFDHTYEPQIEMYDKLPYARDIEVCDWKSPRMMSGNVVKFFQYELGKEQIIQNDFEVEPEEEDEILEDTTDSETEIPDDDFGALLTEELPPDTPLEEELSELSDSFDNEEDIAGTEEIIS